MSESLLVALIGGVLGVALAYGGIQLLLYLQPAQLPRLNEITLDPIVLLFTLGISLVAGLLFGAIPIAEVRAAANGIGAEGQLARIERRPRAASRAQHAGRRAGRAGRGAAGRLRADGPHVPGDSRRAAGIPHPEESLTLRISIPIGRRRAIRPRPRARTSRSSASIEAIAGVESVGVTSESRWAATTTTIRSGSRTFPAATGDPAAAPPQVHRRRLLRDDGQPHRRRARNHVERRAQCAQVALVSENLAREYWGEPGKALGRRIRRTAEDRRGSRSSGSSATNGRTAPPTVAGDRLLADDELRGLDRRSEHFVQRSLAYAIRSSRLKAPGFLKEVQQAVWSVNPNLPLARVRTMQQIYDESMAQTSFALVILGIAASVTLLLGLVGIYGVIAYIVVAASPRSRHPHGARRAERDRCSGSSSARGLLLTAHRIGGRPDRGRGADAALSSLLFGVSPFDPLTYAAVIAGLGGSRCSPRGYPRVRRRASIRCWRCEQNRLSIVGIDICHYFPNIKKYWYGRNGSWRISFSPAFLASLTTTSGLTRSSGAGPGPVPSSLKSTIPSALRLQRLGRFASIVTRSSTS